MDMTLYALLMSKLKNRDSQTLNGVKVEIVETLPNSPERDTLYILLESENEVKTNDEF